jgi:hypothetical protein
MLTATLAAFFNLILPRHAAWVVPLVAQLFALIFELVREHEDLTHMPGPQRREFVLREVAEAIDGLDEVPAGWAALSEAQRDAIIRGILELALLTVRSQDDDGTGKAVQLLRRRRS